MSFIDRLARSDRRHKLASGIMMPVMMPVGGWAAMHMMNSPAVVSFLICVMVALSAFGLYNLLGRLFLRKLTLGQQALIGSIGWIASVPIFYLFAKYYLFV
jgi:hypothetical protein